MSDPRTRRDVLRTAAALAITPAVLDHTDPRRSGARERPRCLLLIDLFGGLDGLNAVVPFGDDLYYRARPHLAVPAASLHRIDDYRGLAPALAPLCESWESGRMAVVEGVGYAPPNLSHFKSSMIWHRALPANAVDDDGWIARLRGSLWPDDPRVELITQVGGRPSGAIYSGRWPSLQFDSPASFAVVGAQDAAMGAAAGAGESEDPSGLLRRLERVHRDGLHLAPEVLAITRAYEPRVDYPSGDFAGHLRTIAALIQAGFGTRVYSLTHESFDSHSSGLVNQEDKLREWAAGIDAFLRDLAGTPAEREVLVLSSSEFGRRLEENAALGTDHGAAAPVFLHGARVRGGLHGTHPSLEALDDSGNLRHAVDFRSVFAAVIDDWFGGDHRQVLRAEYPVAQLIDTGS